MDVSYRLTGFDALLLSMFGSLPASPDARWELRCHPSVASALHAAGAQDVKPCELSEPHGSRYGHADVVVDSERLAAGEWELRPEGAAPDSEPVLSGRISTPITWTEPQPLPAGWYSWKLDPPRTAEG